MRHITFILLAFLLISCSESSKPQPSAVDDGVDESYDREKVDSVCENILQKAKEEVESEKISSSSTSKTSHSEIKYDNMRGFDPASEDDMDDNGMSRFMENNDEEGWD